jgi:hypothetical protein
MQTQDNADKISSAVPKDAFCSLEMLRVGPSQEALIGERKDLQAGSSLIRV